MCVTDSPSCTSETNTVNQLYSDNKSFYKDESCKKMTLDLGMDWRRAREERGMLSEREGVMSTDDRSQLS